MNKVTAICGKVGSDKTYYAQKLMKMQKIVLLSNDELLHDVLPNTHPGNQKDLMKRINGYLMKKAVELVRCGCDVILDWGFWQKEERTQLTRYFEERKTHIKWVYIPYLNEDEEILERANRLFEPPEADEGMIVVE